MKKFILPLVLLLSLFSQPKAQTVFTAGKEHLGIKNKSFELRLDDYNDKLENMLGYSRFSSEPISLYVDRTGLTNFQFGAERKNIYFNLEHSSTNDVKINRGIQNTRRDNKNTIDFGANIPLWKPIDLETSIEGAYSLNEIDILRIKPGQDTTASRADHLIGASTGKFNLSSKYFALNYFLNNNTDFEEIDETSGKAIVSLTDPSYFDYTWSGDFKDIKKGNHSAYLTARNNWINVFAQFDSLDFDNLNLTGLKNNLQKGKLIIGSGNYFDTEVRNYHRALENNLRNVDRLYDLFHETEKSLLEDVFFNSGFETLAPLRKGFRKIFGREQKNNFLDEMSWHNSFRTEFQQEQKPIYELNSRVRFKNLRFYLGLNNNKDYSVGISYSKILAGIKNNDLYGGHIINEK